LPAQPFEDVRASVDQVVKKVFPNATRGELSPGIRGWLVQRPPGAPRPAREGTMPSDRIFVGLAERKAGPTLYVWYPGDAGLSARRAALEKAGFEVMVGCLVYAKKRPYPIGAVEDLLSGIRDQDAR
jgi:hypothetical protein